MYLARSSVWPAVLFCLLSGSGIAQNKKPNPDAGYLPIVAPEDNKKKKQSEETQVLALPPELPLAVSAETGRLAFQVTPLSAKGLLSQQTREALKTLLHARHETIVKLRAFVAGSGDLRRVGEITGEMFQEKHQALPALTVLQVGALPLEGAQVEIEATVEDRRAANPAGVAFFAAQAGASVGEALEKLKSAMARAGMQPSDALLVTCFVSSLDEQRDVAGAMPANFPGAALDWVQMQRAPVTPAAECEGTARMRTAASSFSAQAALISAPEIVITGTQLAFGSQDSDLKLAFDRLEKALAGKNARLDHAAVSHLFVTSGELIGRVSAMESERSKGATTLLPVEALPSLDASFGLDAIAVP